MEAVITARQMNVVLTEGETDVKVAEGEVNVMVKVGGYGSSANRGDNRCNIKVEVVT